MEPRLRLTDHCLAHYYFARRKPHKGFTLRVIQEQVPVSTVALRNGLHTLIAARLVREDKSGKSAVYQAADPERLSSLAAYVEQSDPDLATDREPGGLLWARALVPVPNPRRRK